MTQVSGDQQCTKAGMHLSGLRQLGLTRRQTDTRFLGNVQELDLNSEFRSRPEKCANGHKMLCMKWPFSSSLCSKETGRQP